MSDTDSGIVNLSEREICEKLYSVFKEGEQLREEGTPNKYPANTLFYMMSVLGWVQKDLQLALMKASPVYRKNQEARPDAPKERHT